MTATATRNTSYVGVDLIAEQVVMISRRADLIRDAYILEGENSPALDGTIFLHDDGTFNGRRALAIALDESQQGIGLGWTFKVA